MQQERPTTILLREDDRNPGHVRVSVWIGRTPGSRGNSGTLTIRTDEWDELREEIEARETSHRICSGEDRPLFEITTLEEVSR